MYCKNFKGIVVTEPPDTSDMLVGRIRCKMWNCEYCAVVNANIWRTWIVKRIGEMGGEWAFLTLTAHQNAHKHGRTLENMREGWKRIYDRLRAKFAAQGKLEYVRVFERHKKGTFHIHAIIRADIGDRAKFKRWLKTNATACGMGHQVDCRQITGDKSPLLVASYIVKYMTKQAQDLGDMPKGLRRIQASQGIGAAKPDVPKYDWRVRAGVYLPDLWEHERVVDISTGEVLPEYYFKSYLYWPEHEHDEGS